MGVTKNLVLGGSGTIGLSLCHFLKAKNEDVVNLDLKNGFDLRTQSLEDYSNADFVWFLAWEVGGAKFLSNPAHQYPILSDNALICSNVFSFLKRTKIPFIFTSSQLASPDSPYGLTKLLGEKFTETLGGVNVRFWNVYGWEEPGEKSHVITDMVLQALTQNKITLLTTGEEERQFIYIDDCVKNLYEIRRSGKPGKVHLTNGKWMKIIDLSRIVAKFFDVPVEPGTVIGYQNKINPDSSFLRFEWPTSLENGIQLIADQAREFLKTSTDARKYS